MASRCSCILVCAYRPLLPTLGPGFDAFGMALTVYNEFTVRPAEHGLKITIEGEGEDGTRTVIEDNSLSFRRSHKCL